MKKYIVLAIFMLSSSPLVFAAGLHVQTKIVWLGQFATTKGFYFAALDKDQTCPSTRINGHYYVDGVNSEGVYSMLLTAAASGKLVSFSINGCHHGRAKVSEIYLHS